MKQPITDWIEWTGGECPVSPDAHVEVEFERIEWDGKAGGFEWQHGSDAQANIIAYRLVV